MSDEYSPNCDLPPIPSFDDPALKFVDWEGTPLAVMAHGLILLCVFSDKSFQFAPPSWNWSDISLNSRLISRKEALKIAPPRVV